MIWFARRAFRLPCDHGYRRINVAGISDVGRERERNEDQFCVVTRPEVINAVDGLFVVADGMGGHAGGEVASGMAVETLRSLFTRGPNGGRTEPTDPLAHLKGAVEYANSRIHQQAMEKRELAGMGTTVTALAVEGCDLLIAHVGDSRAYMIHGEEITQLTQDHSWVAEQVEMGIMGPEEAREHPRRNLITRALGLSREVEVDTGRCPLPRRSTLLICSDGLIDLVRDEEMVQVVRNARTLEVGCRRLVRLANERGGYDNITVVLARVS